MSTRENHYGKIWRRVVFIDYSWLFEHLRVFFKLVIFENTCSFIKQCNSIQMVKIRSQNLFLMHRSTTYFILSKLGALLIQLLLKVSIYYCYFKWNLLLPKDLDWSFNIFFTWGDGPNGIKVGAIVAAASLLVLVPAIAFTLWRQRTPQQHFFDVPGWLTRRFLISMCSISCFYATLDWLH